MIPPLRAIDASSCAGKAVSNESLSNESLSTHTFSSATLSNDTFSNETRAVRSPIVATGGDPCPDRGQQATHVIGVPNAARSLCKQAVLCVGGLHRAIANYRAIVEARGGRFLHHDGGREESAQRLDAILTAADLVVCQAGCISHSAYRQVKDHCKRTGKRCVYLQKPSTSAFTRGLAEVGT